MIFDYYASLNGDGRISSMTFNEWGMFVEDVSHSLRSHIHRRCTRLSFVSIALVFGQFNLSDQNSEWSKRADLDRVFIAVDTKASMIAKAAAEASAKAGRKAGPDLDEKKALKRVEFFTALVQVGLSSLGCCSMPSAC